MVVGVCDLVGACPAVNMAGGMHGGGMHGRGHVWQGACVAGRCVWWGACVAGEMAIVADGMHPTGIHSCFTGVCQSFCPQGSLYDVTSWLAAWSRVHFRGVSVQRVSVGETPPDRDPPPLYSEERTVSILLECLLTFILYFFLTFILNLKVLSLF